MNKIIIIGIVISIIIGVSIISISNNSSGNFDEILPDEEIQNEPNQFTVGLDESVGVSGG